MSKSSATISFSRWSMSLGSVGRVSSYILSTGSIRPIPKADFHNRLAMTVANRGLSGDANQLAYDAREPFSSRFSSSSTTNPKIVLASIFSPGFALSY